MYIPLFVDLSHTKMQTPQKQMDVQMPGAPIKSGKSDRILPEQSKLRSLKFIQTPTAPVRAIRISRTLTEEDIIPFPLEADTLLKTQSSNCSLPEKVSKRESELAADIMFSDPVDGNKIIRHKLSIIVPDIVQIMSPDMYLETLSAKESCTMKVVKIIMNQVPFQDLIDLVSISNHGALCARVKDALQLLKEHEELDHMENSVAYKKIGNKLFPIVQKMLLPEHESLTGKVVGMLLEAIPFKELHDWILSNYGALRSQVDYALKLLLLKEDNALKEDEELKLS